MESTEFPTTDEWIRKKWYIYAVEYHRAGRNDVDMQFVITWMKDILNEESQKRDKYRIISFYVVFRITA